MPSTVKGTITFARPTASGGHGFIVLDSATLLTPANANVFFHFSSVRQGTPQVGARARCTVRQSVNKPDKMEATDLYIFEEPMPGPGRHIPTIPQPAMTPATGSRRFAAIIIDGYFFAMATSHRVEAVQRLKRFVEKAVKSADPSCTQVIFPLNSLHCFFPDQMDALRRNLASQEQAIRTHNYLSELKSLGYMTHLAQFERSGDRWVASAEDVELSNLVTDLVEKDKFDPIGTNPQRVTLTDVFIVTGNMDHLSTLADTRRDERHLRWCIMPENHRCRELEVWGSQTQRLLRFPMTEPPAGPRRPDVRAQPPTQPRSIRNLRAPPPAVQAPASDAPSESNEEAIEG